MRKQSARNHSNDSVSFSDSEKETFILDRALAACRRPWWSGVSAVVLTGGMILGGASTSGGASYIWTGSGSGDSFADPANWGAQAITGPQLPGDIVTFGTLGVAGLTPLSVTLAAGA